MKNKKKKFLLKVLVGAIMLTPTFSNSAHAEEKVFGFDVNVAKAESSVNSNEVKSEAPLVTEEAKKQASNSSNTSTTSAPIQQSSNVVQSAPVVSSVTPTEPSTATGKIVSDAKDENNKAVSKKQREFLEFTTNNGKKLYLIIDRADIGKEVKLVTEVSPQDLASMIDGTKVSKQQETKEAPKSVSTKEVKQESGGVSVFVYIFGIALILAIGFIIFAGFKKRQKKGQEELEELEEAYEDNYEEQKR